MRAPVGKPAGALTLRSGGTHRGRGGGGPPNGGPPDTSLREKNFLAAQVAGKNDLIFSFRRERLQRIAI